MRVECEIFGAEKKCREAKNRLNLVYDVSYLADENDLEMNFIYFGDQD